MADTAETAARPLTGPSFGPADGSAAQWLVVLLHGLGADGRDLIGLAPYLAEAVPAARIVAPDGPEACDMAPFGRQWFSLQDRAPEKLYAGVGRARTDLLPFIAAELGRLGLGPERLILGGFSQGAMTALHVGLRLSAPPAGILAFSGALVGAEKLADEIAARPPVLLVHGSADEIVAVDALARAEAALRSERVAVEAHELSGLGHGIDERAIALAVRFLARISGDT